tara:strand:- start:261047 stop:262285 length:1239 start_codon:yes stop_codon:yes gene_type:complete
VKILKAFRYLLAPTDAQEILFYKMAGCGRVVYNDTLDYLLNIIKKDLGITDRKALYKHLNSLDYKARKALFSKLPHHSAMNKLVTAWKKLEHREWLSEAYRDNLDQRQRDLHKALEKWLKGAGSFPRFRQRSTAHHSTMRFVNFNKYCALHDSRVKLPNKLGLVKFRNSQPIEGTPKSCTVSLNACGQWHISILCELEVSKPMPTAETAVGIDMGIAKNMTLSDGTVYSGVHSFKGIMGKLAKSQRKFARQEKGSNNWKKQKLKIAKLHQKAANARRDFQQKATTEISKNHAMIVVEDLKVSNMSRSAKGDAENHGKNVRQKAGLNRSILDQGWGEIRRQLEYKSEWLGNVFHAVPPHHTSQTCPACRHKAKENRLTQAEFICVECGFSENADVVGAINVLHRGMALEASAN